MSDDGEFRELQRIIRKFCDDRNWDQFHNLKDLAISLNLEAAEVLEKFQWLSQKEMDNLSLKNRDDIAEELSDVFYWVLLMSEKLDVDLVKTFKAKMIKNAKKYPVDKAKNSHRKYTEIS